jgi:hypothetical protein
MSMATEAASTRSASFRLFKLPSIKVPSGLGPKDMIVLAALLAPTLAWNAGLLYLTAYAVASMF